MWDRAIFGHRHDPIMTSTSKQGPTRLSRPCASLSAPSCWPYIIVCHVADFRDVKWGLTMEAVQGYIYCSLQLWLYCCGIDLQLLNLYPRIEYPVSRGTPMISPFIKWDHSDDWFVAADINLDQLKQFDTVISIMMKKPENEYLYGHVVDGRNLYPATGYLMMVAETFCLDQSDTVIFEDVKFIRATNIPKDGALTFNISYSPGNNRFEIVEGGAVIVTGYLRLDKSSKQLSEILDPPLPAEGVSMAQKDIYKELRLRGYNYSGLFRSFIGLDPTGCVGSIAWENNYVAYMDNMLQMIIFSKDTRNLYVPIQIERLTIDFKKHTEAVAKYNKQNALPVYCWKELALVCSGGIEIFGLNASPITRRRVIADPVLETYGFLPFQGHKTMTLDHLLQVAVHLALENGPCTNKIKVIEMPNDQKEELFSPRVVNILRDLPLLVADITVLLEPAPTEPPHGVLFESRDLKNESGCFMVLASGLLSSGNYKNVELVLATLANNGCIISKETTDFTTSKQKILADLGADIIMDWTLPAGTDRLIVAKKQQKSNSHEVKVVNLLCENYSWLPILQQLVKEKHKNVILVAQDDNCSGILGLINCVRKEVGGDQDVRCVFIMDPTAPKFDPNLKFYQDQLSIQLAVNVFYDGTWGSYRHLPIQEPSTLKVKHAFNTVTSSGDLSSFAWLQGPLDAIRDSEIDGFVHIYFSALNFRDVMIASGKLSPDVVYIQRQKQDCLQGFEFSGRDKHGRRVMGVARSGSMASAVIGIPDLQLEVPDYWTLEDAATVPVVYFTVILALKVTAKMQPGCSILIHAGSGGVGQAAINYCLFHGCTIFTTVGTTQKKEFIRKTFPQIPDTHIGNSRDTSFEQMIMEQTNGRGVDIVLNSLSEEKLQASVRSLASGGKFIEIGKFDLAIDNKLYAESFSKDKSFSAVMLDQLFHMGGEELIALSKLFSEALQEGSVKPLVRTVFGLNEVEQAYRYLAAGKHIGKVLVSIRPEENQVVCHPDELHLEARRRFYCNPYQTYIIVGGLGGFGLELTDWLILRQAKKIVLTSRTGITNGYQQSRLNTWKGYGVDVIISTEDISSDEGVCKLLEVAGKIGEVAGIFNLAVDLHDALLENQTPDSFQKSALPKAVATKLLDKWSRIMCPRLSQFVVFSSVSCGRGNVGQSNYGWSNSVMERICENRNRQNLPALAIQWGAIGEVGLVADMKDNDLDIVIGGTLPQRLTSCLSVMDDFLLQPHPVVASMVVAEKKTDFSKSAGILDYVTSILGIKDLKLVNPNATLAELGMDSMMAVEIKQTVETTFDVFLTAEDVRNISLASLESMADRSGTEEEKNTSQNNSSLKDTVKFEFSNQLSEILKWNVILQCEVQLMESLPGAKDIFLLPGMEGIAETFSQLSVKLLANSVKCLQTGFDNNQISSIQEVTNVFLPYVLNSLQGSGGTFTLLGHSYGGILALQLATLLEAHGYKGCIFLIDITPVSLYKYAPKFLGQDIGTLVLLRFLTYIGCNKIQIAEFQKQCHNITDWAQKLESALGIIKSSEIECSITARPLLTTICHRLTEMCNYVPSYKNIKSDIVLIKAKESQVVTEADVYEMQEISDNPVEIHEVDGTHFSVLESQELADIINYRLKV